MSEQQEPPEGRSAPWLPRWVAIALVVVVTCAWVANVIIGYLDPARASMAVNVAFTAVMGLLASSATGAVGRLRRRIGGEESTPDRRGGERA